MSKQDNTGETITVLEVRPGQYHVPAFGKNEPPKEQPNGIFYPWALFHHGRQFGPLYSSKDDATEAAMVQGIIFERGERRGEFRLPDFYIGEVK